MQGPGRGGASPGFDAVVVGASLAGCAAAILLGRAGARVALVEKRPDPRAFKRVCTHFIQASAIPTLERLDLLDPIVEAGGVRTSARIWTRWGWIKAPPDRAKQAVNLRRELLDPLVREAAAATPGVELMLGRAAEGLLREGGAIHGVAVRGRGGEGETLRARLVVGADGRDSQVAKLAGLSTKVRPHGRFFYGAYFEDAMPPTAPDTSFWFLDPNWAVAVPTDSGLAYYGVMLTKDRLSEFRRDPASSLVSFVDGLPSAPPIRAGCRVSPMIGKLEMPNRVRGPVAPGLALVGDAALATDPLFGVGCGWALQSSEWLVDSVVPALRGAEPLKRGLGRYRRRRARELWMHTFQIHDYSTGRRMNPLERMLFAAGAQDAEIATAFDAMATRSVAPGRALATIVPRAIGVHVRRALSRQRSAPPVGEKPLG